jgi:hypothetical protein
LSAVLFQVGHDTRGERGAVDKLIGDDALHVQASQVVQEARATIDDFRETTPVTTFTSIFFGAF